MQRAAESCDQDQHKLESLFLYVLFWNSFFEQQRLSIRTQAQQINKQTESNASRAYLLVDTKIIVNNNRRRRKQKIRA